MNPSTPNAPVKIAIVVPTIGRPAELRRMLRSLEDQSRLPDQVIIIDEGHPIGDLAREFPQLDLQVLSLPGGSTSAKRNLGAQVARPGITFIGFMDDDIVLEPGALEVMLAFWETAPPDLGGASCNLVNPPPMFASRLKSLRITSWLGLYGRKNGAVLRSGITIYTGPPHETIYTSWLGAGAVIYSRRVVEEFPFDEWFESFGIGEDLDMSYRAGKKYKLAMVAGARFNHYPSQLGRPDPYLFGKKEVLNRLYFVSKHAELASGLCVIGLLTRTAVNLFLGISTREVRHFKRAWGNCAGLLLALTTGMKPVTR